MKDLDVHKIDRRYELALKHLEKSKILSKNKELILEFRDYAFSKGLTKARVLKYLNNLRRLAGWLDIPFKKAKKEDLMRVVRKIEQGNYSEWTKHGYKVMLKKFYKWLNGDEEYPEKVKWLKTSFKKNNQRLPEDLLTYEDVEKMIDAADNVRDKALVSLLYESGCRISEILTMRIKHSTFDDFGTKITVHGKKGSRRVRVINSTPYLSTWYAVHPLRNDPMAPLWIAIGSRNKNKAIKYQNTRLMIASLAKKIGLNKRVNPHNFRHSRATHMSNHLTEAQMNHYFGWKQGSEMPSTYVHLSGRDIDTAIIKMNKLEIDETEKEHKFIPRKCHRCERMNPSNGKFCLRCGAPLDIETAIGVEKGREKADNAMESLLQDLLKNQKIRNIIEKRAEKMNIAI